VFLSHIFHEAPVMSIRGMTTPPHTHTHTHFPRTHTHQHMLLQSAFSPFSICQIEFLPPHYMSDGGSGVCGCVCGTLFKRVYFSQYHLFSLPLTQLYCIKRTEHNICCQLMYAVIDINISVVQYFTSHLWKLSSTLCAVYAGKEKKKEDTGRTGRSESQRKMTLTSHSMQNATTRTMQRQNCS